MGSPYLVEIIITDGNFKTVGFKSFMNCSHLKRLVFPLTNITIEDSAFEGCNRILCGGLFLHPNLTDRASTVGMPTMPLSPNCLNNFDALLRRPTCNHDKRKMRFGPFFSLILGKQRK